MRIMTDLAPPFDLGHTAWCDEDCSVNTATYTDGTVVWEVVHHAEAYHLPLRSVVTLNGEESRHHVGLHLTKMQEHELDGAARYALTDVVLDGKGGTYSLTAREAARLGAALLRASRLAAGGVQ